MGLPTMKPREARSMVERYGWKVEHVNGGELRFTDPRTHRRYVCSGRGNFVTPKLVRLLILEALERGEWKGTL